MSRPHLASKVKRPGRMTARELRRREAADRRDAKEQHAAAVVRREHAVEHARRSHLKLLAAAEAYTLAQAAEKAALDWEAATVADCADLGVSLVARRKRSR